MVQNWTKFGHHLRNFRKRSGLSQKQLTYILNNRHHLDGISNGLISKWERAYEHQGRRWYPDRQTVLRMILIFAPYITPDEARHWGTTAGYRLTTEEIRMSFPHLSIDTTATSKTQTQNGDVTHNLPSDISNIVDTLVHQGATKLPPQITPFVGRQAEITDLVQLLTRSEIQLLTLTGPGGIGKTRLAIEVAKQVDEFLNGIYFVNLASLTDATMIVSAIAEAIGFTFHNEQGTPKQQLLDYLPHLARGIEFLMSHINPASSLP